MAKSRVYLVAYNLVGLCLWTLLTLTTVARLLRRPVRRPLDIYGKTLPLLRFTQSIALLEIAHAAFGLVRASPTATAIQIGGKNLVVWTVMSKFPVLIQKDDDIGNWAYLGCVLAWGCSEMIRYGFFTTQLIRGAPPRWLSWLRYNSFLVLYPIGILSEAALVYLGLTQGKDVGLFYRAYLLLGLLMYAPAGPYLYSHMLSQRRKVQGKQRKRAK